MTHHVWRDDNPTSRRALLTATLVAVLAIIGLVCYGAGTATPLVAPEPPEIRIGFEPWIDDDDDFTPLVECRVRTGRKATPVSVL